MTFKEESKWTFLKIYNALLENILDSISRLALLLSNLDTCILITEISLLGTLISTTMYTKLEMKSGSAANKAVIFMLHILAYIW